MSWLDEEISTDTVNPDQLDRGTCKTAGKYHVELLAVKEDENKKSGAKDLRFDFQILAGTVKTEVGNVFYHREQAPNGDETRIYHMTKLAVQLGAVKKEEVGPGKALNPRKFFDAEGRQYVISVVETPDKKDPAKGPYYNLGRVWDVNDEAVADVPKDIEALESAGVSTGASTPGKSAATTPKTETPLASTEDFDDL